jgi:hypothetical protein
MARGSCLSTDGSEMNELPELFVKYRERVVELRYQEWRPAGTHLSERNATA